MKDKTPRTLAKTLSDPKSSFNQILRENYHKENFHAPIGSPRSYDYMAQIPAKFSRPVSNSNNPKQLRKALDLDGYDYARLGSYLEGHGFKQKETTNTGKLTEEKYEHQDGRKVILSLDDHGMNPYVTAVRAEDVSAGRHNFALEDMGGIIDFVQHARYPDSPQKSYKENPLEGSGVHTRMEAEWPARAPMTSANHSDADAERTGGISLKTDEELDAIAQVVVQGQPPAKIANPRGLSGSSGVFRANLGKPLPLSDNMPDGHIQAVQITVNDKEAKHRRTIQELRKRWR